MLVSGTRQFKLPYSIDVIVIFAKGTANPIHRKDFFSLDSDSSGNFDRSCDSENIDDPDHSGDSDDYCGS